MKRNEDGAALAIVLFFITILSLWLASVAFLSQTSAQTISTNSKLSEFRSQITTSAFQQALASLTDLSKGADGRYGMDFDGRRCDDPTIASLIGPFNTSVNGRSVSVKVSCTQQAFSGYQFPLASFMLTGTGCPTNTGCITGQDGGLAITNPSAKDCTTPTAPRLQVSGGLLNASGAWKSVNCATLELQQLAGGTVPLVNQPDSAVEACPGATRFDVGSCQCPTWFTQIPGSPDLCPAGNAFTDIDPSNVNTYNNAFMQSVASGLGTPIGAASIVGDCGTTARNANSSLIPGTSLWAVAVNPGTVDSSLLAQINSLTASNKCGDGSVQSSPMLWFKPGVYRFDTGVGTGVSKSSSNTLSINGPIKVVAGVVTSSSTCDTSKQGAEFQFGGSTYFELISGGFTICPYRISRGEIGVTFAAPAANSGLTWSWNGSRSDPFMYVQQGNASLNSTAVSFTSTGMVFAPGGWANLTINGTTNLNFANGAVYKGVTMSVTGSAQSAGAVKPPPPYNGDRSVQLRFWDATNGRDLGLVQLIIKDYFARKPGTGYKVVTWRTMW